MFSEEDFMSIQRIGDSLKKTAEDKAKIGRFGIGFNAVYHWSDLPSFVSSNYLVMLDPQARFLPNVNPNNPGKMVDWVKDPSVLSSYSDQFAPYQAQEGLDWSRPFNGTLFRLPLRTPDQAQTSSLSKRALAVSEASALLAALSVEASAMLLFLKNIETIEIKQWDVGAAAPIVRFRCSIANVSRELREKRTFVGDTSSSSSSSVVGLGTSQRKAAIRTADYSLLIDCTTNSGGAGGGEKISYQEVWEICNQLGGEGANAIASNPANELLRLIPWGGLAACVSERRANINGLREGLAYCFLPLPVQTGLPVMINGFFELSSNRRDVWQAHSIYLSAT